MLGATNLLTPLSYASAATKYDSLTSGNLTANPLIFEMPDKDVMLYAHTDANHYYVEYSGTTKTSWTMPNSEFIYDQENQHLSGNAYAKTWYSFSTWTTEPNGGGTSYEDGALVNNWTDENEGTVPIYAQWSPIRYYITYDLNDNDGGTSSWVHSKTPTSGLYDETLTILHPSRTWYVFSGWEITGMDGETHVISGDDYSGTTDNHEMATSYANLHANGGTVTFTALWDRDKVKYLVEHYKETFTDNDYSIKMTGDTVDGSWLADTNITPAVETYDWFTSPSTVTTGIKADGSTYVRYNYDRNSYTLTMNAGRWIASVTATGEYNTVWVTTDSTNTAAFKYEDPIKVSAVLKDWYESLQWSGHSDGASSFTMPAENIEKTAYATPIIYNITYEENGATTSAWNPTTYTVETSGVNLNHPTGTHSTFLWWTGWVVDGEQLPDITLNVEIPYQSTWNRSYKAMWRCDTWYHASNSSNTGDVNYGNCIENTDTAYKVEHHFQNLAWTAYVHDSAKDEDKSGKTDTTTNETGNVYPWFVVSSVVNTVINWDGTWVAKVYYDRLAYSGNITDGTGLETTATWPNDEDWKHKYGDTVTLSAETESGYTFDHWTVVGDWINVTINSGDANKTFTMPASDVTITSYATTNVYTISYELHDGSATNPTTYTVEDNFTLNEPTRDHSVFLWWSWTNITSDYEKPITINHMIGNRTYEAIWWCATWYHASGANECVANTYHISVPNLNWTGHSAPDDIVFTYDRTETLPVTPDQSWYDFVWWIVSWMSGWVEHKIWEITVTSDDTYEYSGTSLEFMNLTVENGGTVTLTAIWKARTDTKYVINHYYRDINQTTYSLSWTDTLSGTTDTDVVFADHLQNKEWFTYSGWYVNDGDTTRPAWAWVTTGNIAKDGSLIINLYYDRHKWTVSLSGDVHVDTLSGAGVYDYEDIVNVSATAKTWYHFVNWTKTSS